MKAFNSTVADIALVSCREKRRGSISVGNRHTWVGKEWGQQGIVEVSYEGLGVPRIKEGLLFEGGRV
jgi:hypothetical protein